MNVKEQVSDTKAAITGFAVFVGLLLIIGFGGAAVPLLSRLFGSAPLSAESVRVEGFPVLSLTNKSTGDVTIGSVRINNRDEPACQLKINKKMRVGETQSVIIVGCIGLLDKMVRAEVKTDQGSFEFTW